MRTLGLVVVVGGLSLVGCAGRSEPSTGVLATDPGINVVAVSGSFGQDNVTEARIEGLIVPQADSAVLDDLVTRVQVTRATFNARGGLTAVTFRLHPDNTDLEGSFAASGIVLDRDGRIVEVVTPDAASVAGLVIDIVNGEASMKCVGDCPPAFPVCSMVKVEVGDLTRYDCICKAAAQP